MRENHYLGLSNEGFHRVYYTEWGESQGRNTIICVHGLTRNARDFDFLAKNLQDRYRVVCPDIVGRGKSGRFLNPENYTTEQYFADITPLIARLGVEEVGWVGTSMGGVMGMMLASQRNTPIKALVINDVGPELPLEVVTRIGVYASIKMTFQNREEAESFLRMIYEPFGIDSEEQWDHVITHSILKEPDETYTLSYDPQVAGKLINANPEELVCWDCWEKIRCPVLLLHGAESDILTDEVVARMRETGPPLDYIKISGVGHAPTLMNEKQIGFVRSWLENHF